MPAPSLLLHLPDRGNRLESSPAAIEEHRVLAEERGHVWLCKPGRPLDQALRQELELAFQEGSDVCLYLYVRLSLQDRQIALYRAQLLDVEGPGPNADKEHLLPWLRRKGCGTWLKLMDLESIPAEQIFGLYDRHTDQPVAIWDDLRTELHVVRKGEPASARSLEPSYWLLCLTESRARAEFERAWRFKPIATYQPGSAEIVAQYEAGTSQWVLVYDHVFGSPTYLAILGVYELNELVAEGTTAGAMLYAAQLRSVVQFSAPPLLDPRHDEELWNQLEIAKHPAQWKALMSGDRVLMPLSATDFERILAHTGLEPDDAALEEVLTRPTEGTDVLQEMPELPGLIAPDLASAVDVFEKVRAKPVQEVTEVECYHLLRVLERALRRFIQYELLQVSENWWVERLPGACRNRAEERKLLREHPFPWLAQQNLPAWEYLDFSDYGQLIVMQRNWDEVFRPIFIVPEVIQGKLIELNILRNDIAHMRGLPTLDKETFLFLGWQLLLTVRERMTVTV